MSRRALIISYYWPPTGGSGVQRWVKFSKYLPSEGWQPVIYTPENPEQITLDQSLAAEIPAEVEVIKRPILEPYGIWRLLTGKKKGGAQKGEVNPINSQKKSLKQKLGLWVRGNFFIPDPRCWWIGPSVRFLEKYLKEHPVDVIISTGPPHSMHLIARKVALATGTPWVADFRDPWTRMFYFKHLGLSKWAERKHLRLEKQVLDDASAVVAVSPLVQKDFQSMTSTPVELITNGFDEDDYKGELPGHEGKFHLVHTGLFASDGIPEILWKVLADKVLADPEFASALRIRLVGKTDREVVDSIARAGLSAQLDDLGYQPHMTAVLEQRSADILMLPLRKEPEYRAVLPGKLFEYLAARRPIIGIGQSDGAMATIVSDMHAGTTFEWTDEEGMRGFIDEAWEAFKAGRNPYAGLDIDRFSRRSTTRQMAALLERLTGTSAN